MAKKLKSQFILETKVTKAEVSVQTVISKEAGKDGRLIAELDLVKKSLKIDLCSYGCMTIENTKLLGEALVALSKEAQDAIENL
jgi:hypothetical protein